MNGVGVVAALLAVGLVLREAHNAYWIAFIHPLAQTIVLLAAVGLSMAPWTARWPTAVRLALAFALAAVPMMFALQMSLDTGPPAPP